MVRARSDDPAFSGEGQKYVTQTNTEARPGVQEISAESIEQTSRERGEPDWLLQQRLAAWSLAQALPLPDQRTEGWRRIDLGGLELDRLVGQQGTGIAGEAQSTLADNLSGVAGSLRIVDGQVAERYLAPELERRGVVLTSLRAAVGEKPDLVQQHLGRLVTGEESKLVALAAALWADGLFLYVPRGVAIEQPILSRVASTNGAPTFFRSLIVTDQATDVTIVEDFVSDDGAGESLAS